MCPHNMIQTINKRHSTKVTRNTANTVITNTVVDAHFKSGIIQRNFNFLE